MEPAVTTAISAVREDNNSDGIAYALNGRRAEKSAKGIVIKNGKKHIIK